MNLEDRKKQIQLLENGLEILIERTKELLSKEDFNEFDRGIVKDVIKQIREHEEKLKKLKSKNK